jgi:hypothetical protein
MKRNVHKPHPKIDFFSCVLSLAVLRLFPDNR